MKIVYTLILMSFLCCAKKTKLESIFNTTIMTNTTKNFAYEPIYRLKVSSSLSYIVKINGLTVGTKNQNAGNDRWFIVNNTLPKSGDQHIEIILLPQINASGTAHMTKITDEDFFELEIENTSWENGGMKDPKIVYSYKLPDEIAANKNIYIHNAVFNAEVPYQLEDWREGKDLNKIDSVELKNKVLDYYNQLKNYYENQQGEKFLKEIEKGIYNLAQGAYMKPDEFTKLIKEEVSFINEEPTPLENIENYKLEISGNGRIVSLKRIDGYNTGEGVLRRVFTDNGQKFVYVDDISFYIPKGKESLEVIHYQNLEKPFLP